MGKIKFRICDICKERQEGILIEDQSNPGIRYCRDCYIAKEGVDTNE